MSNSPDARKRCDLWIIGGHEKTFYKLIVLSMIDLKVLKNGALWHIKYFIPKVFEFSLRVDQVACLYKLGLRFFNFFFSIAACMYNRG